MRPGGVKIRPGAGSKAALHFEAGIKCDVHIRTLLSRWLVSEYPLGLMLAPPPGLMLAPGLLLHGLVRHTSIVPPKENSPHRFNSSEPTFEAFGDCTAPSPLYQAVDVQHAFAQHSSACIFTALCKSRRHLCIAILKSHILYTPPPPTTTTMDHLCCSNGNQAGLHHVSFWLRT